MSDPPSDECAEELRHLLATSVPLGLDTQEELADAIDDLVLSLGGDAEWCLTQLEQALAAKRIDEATWPEVLDTDRLDDVFAELEQRSILCCPDAGYTNSDALEIVDATWRENGGRESGIAGFCVFQRQDAERALAGGGLFLGYGVFGGDEALSITIGRKVEHRLASAGFDVEWDGTAATRIRITQIDMRRRGLMEYADDE